MSAEFSQLRDLTPQENNARVMGIFERNIRMESVIREGLSSINQAETGVVPQDWIDGINVARGLVRHTIAITYGDILDNGNETEKQMAHLDLRLNEARITHPAGAVFGAKELGESLGKFVMEYQGDEYEDIYVNPKPRNRKSDW